MRSEDSTFILNPDGRTVGRLLEEEEITQVYQKSQVVTHFAKKKTRCPAEARTTVYLANDDEEPTGLWQRPAPNAFEQADTFNYGPEGCSYGPLPIRTQEVLPPTTRRWIGLALMAMMLIGASTSALLLTV